MKTVILCGGKGTRYDIDKPKSLAMIVNKSIIHHLMDIYSYQGFDEFILCLGWKQEYIKEYFLKKCHYFNIEFVDTGQESNTAKRLKLIEEHIPKDDKEFFLTYADALANIDLIKLQARHMTNRNIVTLTAVRPTNQFGILEFDNAGNVVEFKEKPKMSEFINGGFFICNKKIFNYIDLDKNQELEKDILVELVNNHQLGAYKHNNKNSFWETLNTSKDEINLNNILSKCVRNNEVLPWLDIEIS